MSQVNKGRRVAQTRKTLRVAADAWLAGVKADPPTVLNRSGRPFKPSVIRTYARDLEHYILPRPRRSPALGRESRGVESPRGSADREGTLPLSCAGHREPDPRDLPGSDRGRGGPGKPDDPAPAPRARYACETRRRTHGHERVPSGALRGRTCALCDGVLCRPPSWRAPVHFAGTTSSFRETAGPFAGWITVERAWDDEAGVIEPKSVSSRRRVPIVRPYLSDVLEELRERNGRSGAELVFGRTADHPLRALAGPETGGWRRSRPRTQSAKRLSRSRSRASGSTTAATPSERCAARQGSTKRRSPSTSDTPRSTVTDRYTSPIEAEMTGPGNMGKLAACLARGDTEGRLAQLEDEWQRRSPISAEAVRAAFTGDREGFERFLKELREGQGVDDKGRRGRPG